MVSRDIKDNEFSDIFLEDVGDLRRDVFPEIYEEIEFQKKINNELIEEIDIVKSENTELARNQRNQGKLLGHLVLALSNKGGGVEIVDRDIYIRAPSDIEVVWEESDMFSIMTKYKTGRQVLIEMFGGKYKVENFPQLREVLKKENSKKKKKRVDS